MNWFTRPILEWMNCRIRSVALPLFLVIFALPIRAQSWDAVLALKPGDRVKVQESDGPERRGSITSVTQEAISFATGKAQVSVDRPRVKRVQLHSGSRRARNIAIGAGIGVALGVAVDQTVGKYLRNETSYSGRPAVYLAPVGLGAGIGAILAPYRTIYRVK